MKTNKAGRFHRISMIFAKSVKDFQEKDAWGTEFIFRRVNKTEYYLISAGSDQVFAEIREGFYDELQGQDIVIFSGKFIRAPKSIKAD